MTHPFDPDWCIAPGGTLKEWRELNNLPLKAAAKACADMDPEVFAKIESGEQAIGAVLSVELEYGTQIPAYLWLRLEQHYRAALAAGKVDVT